MTQTQHGSRRSGPDRAVSPVIGVILMVAITVILAAVIGTFVLDVGQRTGRASPSASLAVQVNPGGDGGNGTITLAHTGGAGLDARRTRVVVRDASGGEVTFEPRGTATVLSVGDEATYTTNGTATDAIDWDGDGVYEWTGDSNGLDHVSRGASLTVRLVDTGSQRVVYETTLTA